MNVKSKHMVLVLDRDTYRAVNALHAIAITGPDIQKLVQDLEQNHLINCLTKYLDEFSIKTHELGWCEDGKCTYNKDKHK